MTASSVPTRSQKPQPLRCSGRSTGASSRWTSRPEGVILHLGRCGGFRRVRTLEVAPRREQVVDAGVSAEFLLVLEGPPLPKQLRQLLDLMAVGHQVLVGVAEPDGPHALLRADLQAGGQPA